MSVPSPTWDVARDLTVGVASVSDLPDILAILKESPEASMWSEESLLAAVSHGLAWSAKWSGAVAGMLIGRVAADEFEILNLAVGKKWRRHKVATRLVECALESARSAGARNAYLEVRSSNEGGILFYQRMGFQETGRRSNYYQRPKEDAVLLVLQIGGMNP